MIKKIVIAILFSCSLSLMYGQNRKFLIHLNLQENIVLDEQEATASRLDFDQFDEQDVSAMIIDKVNNMLTKKMRKPLEADSVLNKICYSGVQTFSTNRFSKRKSWRKERKNLDYALKLNHAKNRLFVSYAFKVKLLDLPMNEKYFYDRRVGTSELDLYRGNKPRINNPGHEDYVVPEPLKPMKESQMVEAVVDQMQGNGCLKNIFSRLFTNIGVSVRLEKRSLNKSKRPYMYVMIMLSGKQSNYMKKKDKLDRLVRIDETYE